MHVWESFSLSPEFIRVGLEQLGLPRPFVTHVAWWLDMVRWGAIGYGNAEEHPGCRRACRRQRHQATGPHRILLAEYRPNRPRRDTWVWMPIGTTCAPVRAT